MRVTILDDEEGMRVLYGIALRELRPGAQITEFENGDDAWASLQPRPPDLLKTDVNHVGRETADFIALDCRPVLVITGLGLQTAMPGRRLLVLSKPITLDQSRAALDELRV